MKPTVYKTVTTKEGVMLFVERDSDMAPPDQVYDELMKTTFICSAGLTHGNEFLKVVAQPLESNLSGIPYYELTPQEEVIEDIAARHVKKLLLTEEHRNQRWFGFIEGFEAAKAKEFTEEQMHEFAKTMLDEVRRNIGNNNWRPKMFADDYISSIRQPMKIVSAEPSMRKTCSRTEWECNCGIDGSTCDSAIFVPETYEKDGKTFIKLTNIKYE